MALRSRNSVGSIRDAIFCLSFGRLLWLSSLIAIIGAEKDRVQRGYNWQILAHFFDPAFADVRQHRYDRPKARRR